MTEGSGRNVNRDDGIGYEDLPGYDEWLDDLTAKMDAEAEQLVALLDGADLASPEPFAVTPPVSGFGDRCVCGAMADHVEAGIPLCEHCTIADVRLGR